MASNANGDTNNNKDEPEKPSCGERMATNWRSFLGFLYNPKEHTVMGRTGLSWLAILGFYVIFYAVLAAFWAACLAAFMRTIDFTQPTQQNKYSLLKGNPGMTYEPMPSTTDTMLVFNRSSNSSYSPFVKRLDSILKPYYDLKTQYYSNYSDNLKVRLCDATNGGKSNLDYSCLFDVDAMIPPECLSGNNYGYTSLTPCVFLRPNKVYGWKPADYNSGTNANSSYLKNPPSSLFSGPSKLSPGNVAVTCEGENPVDKDNLLGVEFYPPNGFAQYFYPYLCQSNYLPPFVMAKFKVVPGRAIMVWCRLWADGIHHDLTDLQGGIHFELMVDL